MRKTQLLLEILFTNFIRTIKFSDVNVYIKDGCLNDIDIYFVEKATQLPPQTFNTSNLHAYTKQFRFIADPKCGLDLTTSIFDDGYRVKNKHQKYVNNLFFEVSLFDKVLFISGCLLYIFANIYSRSTLKRRKVNNKTILYSFENAIGFSWNFETIDVFLLLYSRLFWHLADQNQHDL